MFNDLNLAYVRSGDSNGFTARIRGSFLTVLASFQAGEPVHTRKHLTLKQLTLGVSSRLRGET